MEDLTGREMVIMAPLVALMIVIGWHPTPLLERMEPSVRAVVERVETANAQAAVASDADGRIVVRPHEGDDDADPPVLEAGDATWRSGRPDGAAAGVPGSPFPNDEDHTPTADGDE